MTDENPDDIDPSLRDVADLAAQIPAPFNARAAWVAAQDRLGIGRPVVKRLPTRPWRAGIWLAPALVVILALALGTQDLRVSSQSAAGHEYVTAVGQQLTVALVDGTRITLAPESRLVVPSFTGAGAREVRLTGEAYFSVVHNAAHPLTVVAPGVVTRDVGTVFDVRAYADDSPAQVTVVEGTVAVGRDRDAAGHADAPTLHAGDVATLASLSARVVHQADVATLTAWRQGRLVFAATPLREVVRALSHTFGLSVTLADSTLGKELVTGEFSNEPIDTVLKAIVTVTNLQYERRGRRVTIQRATKAAVQPVGRPQMFQTTSTRTSDE